MGVAAGTKVRFVADFGRPVSFKNVFGILDPQSDPTKALGAATPWYPAANLARLAPLRPGCIRGQDKSDYDEARKWGAIFQYIVAGVWRVDWYAAGTEPYNDWTTATARWTADANYWKARIDAGETDLLEHIRFEYWNEPSPAPSGFWRGTVPQFIELAGRMSAAYVAVLGTDVKFVGPSTVNYSATAGLTETRVKFGQALSAELRSRNIDLHTYDFHHLEKPMAGGIFGSDTRGLRKSLIEIADDYRAGEFYPEYNLNVREIAVTEIGGATTAINAAQQFGLFDCMERGGADYGSLAAWSPYADKPTLGGLIDGGDDNLGDVTDFGSAEPRAPWWLHLYRQRALGHRVYAEKQVDHTNTIPYNDQGFPAMAATMGFGGTDTVAGTDAGMMIGITSPAGVIANDWTDGTAYIEMLNVRAIPQFRDQTSVRVSLSKLVYGATTLPTGPAVLSTTDYTIDSRGRVFFSIPNVLLEEVRIMRLSRVP